jgi:thioredoxin 1
MNSNENAGLSSNIGEANFESEVLKSKLPVLVAFLAHWSRPCHVLVPVLDEVASACYKSIKVVTVNVDDNIDLGTWYGIQSIPTTVCFVNGEERVRIVGTASKEAILAKLKPLTTTIQPVSQPGQQTKQPKS